MKYISLWRISVIQKVTWWPDGWIWFTVWSPYAAWCRRDGHVEFVKNKHWNLHWFSVSFENIEKCLHINGCYIDVKCRAAFYLFFSSNTVQLLHISSRLQVPGKDTQAEVADCRHTFFHSEKCERGVAKKEAGTLMRCVNHRQSWECDQRKWRRRFPPTLTDENELSSSHPLSSSVFSLLPLSELPFCLPSACIIRNKSLRSSETC